MYGVLLLIGRGVQSCMYGVLLLIGRGVQSNAFEKSIESNSATSLSLV